MPAPTPNSAGTDNRHQASCRAADRRSECRSATSLSRACRSGGSAPAAGSPIPSAAASRCPPAASAASRQPPSRQAPANRLPPPSIPRPFPSLRSRDVRPRRRSRPGCRRAPRRRSRDGQPCARRDGTRSAHPLVLGELRRDHEVAEHIRTVARTSKPAGISSTRSGCPNCHPSPRTRAASAFDVRRRAASPASPRQQSSRSARRSAAARR